MEETEILDTSAVTRDRKGIVTIFTLIEYPASARLDLDVLWPTREDMEKAIDISSKLFQIGKAIPAIDVLIASMAIRRNMRVVTCDAHFSYVKEVEPNFKFVQLSK